MDKPNNNFVNYCKEKDASKVPQSTLVLNTECLLVLRGGIRFD
jgi:hypothetical protein